MKKILAILLSLALVICMLPASAVTAWAAAPTKIIMSDIASKTYTGSLIAAPKIVVKDDQGKDLKEGTDYNLKYEPGVSLIAAGKYTYTATGIGSYKGMSDSKDFVIEQKSISDSSVRISGISTTGYFLDDPTNGVKPEIVVRDGKTLEENKDYKLSYSNNMNVGSATVTITGQGNYTGETTRVFAIKKFNLKNAQISFKSDIGEDDTNEQIASKVVVKQNGTEIPKDYYTVTCTEKNGKITVKVVANSAYKDCIESDSSKETSNITRKVSLENGFFDIASIANQAWKNAKIEPAVKVVKYKKDSSGNIATDSKGNPIVEKTLSKSTDYDVEYAYNEDVGTADVIVTAKGSTYTGSLTGHFNITPRSIKASGITVTVYTAITGELPEVVVKDGSTALKYGVDYDINDVGDNKITITGQGNYTDETKAYSYKTISDSNKLLSDGNTTVIVERKQGSTTYKCNYTGTERKPSVQVKVDGLKDYLSASYYEVVYSDNIKVGSATVKIVGKSGYAGSATANFEIVETDLSRDAKISGVNTSYTYTGKYIEPTPTVKVDDVTLKKDRDYTVSYSLNRSVTTSYSKASVIIEAVKDSGFTGKLTKEFNILEASQATWTASFKDGKDNRNYDGKSSFPAIIAKAGSKTLTEGTDYTVTYKDSKGNVVTGGFKEIGEYKVVVEGITYTGTKTLTYTINGSAITNFTVTLKEYSVQADGTAKKPTIISVKSGSTTLGTDCYTVSYQDSTGKTVYTLVNPDTYKVVVTGKNGYSGTTYATFRVIGLAQSITGVKSSYKMYPNSNTLQLTPSATEGSFTYTSSDSSIASVSSTGVVTAYKAGRAKITIKTTGNTKYDPATISTVIKVYPKKAVMTKKPWTTAKKGQIKVRWNKQDNVTRYEVRYSRAKNFAKGTYITKKVNAAQNDYTTQSTTISKLKSGYKYYVKVRAVKEVYNDNGKMITYYGTWSNWRSVVVK